MKKIIIPVLALTLLSACSSDKQAKLEKLEKQRIELDDQISLLKSELNNDTTDIQNMKVKYVEVSTLKPQVFNHFIAVQGVVNSDENVGITPQMGGKIKKIYVTEGDHVKKGQLLIELDAQVLQNSIEEVESSLGFATEMYNKQKALWEEKIGSEVQYLTAKNNKESLEKKMETLKKQLDMSMVISPIDGTVDKVMTKEGELVAPVSPIVRVVNLSNFKISAAVAENYASHVKNGTDVKLWFPDLKTEIEAQISYAGNVIDPINRTFDIVIRLKKSNVELKPNMLAVVNIVDFNADSALVIPVNIIRKSGENKVVYIAKQEKGSYIAQKQVIKSERNYNGNALVTEGLNKGDKLITFGFQELTDGQVISF